MKKIVSALVGLGMIAGTVVMATPASASVEYVPERDCDPDYVGACVPDQIRDLDCLDIGYRQVNVVGPDTHRLDGDRNGLGCEIWEGTPMYEWVIVDYPNHIINGQDGWSCLERSFQYTKKAEEGTDPWYAKPYTVNCFKTYPQVKMNQKAANKFSKYITKNNPDTDLWGGMLPRSPLGNGSLNWDWENYNRFTGKSDLKLHFKYETNPIVTEIGLPQ